MAPDAPAAWRGETYYGRSQLKPAPFNASVVGGYVFLAGLGGAASMLSAIGGVLRPEARELARHGRYVPLVVPTLGAGLLVWDLHTPTRFYNMFRVAKGTSPMSVGTWILSGFSVSALLSAGLQALGDRRGDDGLRRAAALAQVPAAVLGAGMGTYTAALLAATSTPLWAAAPRALGMRFAAASVASGAAALSLLEAPGGTRRGLDAISGIALAAEVAIGGGQEAAYRRAGVAPGPGIAERAGTVLPLALYALSALRGGRGHLSRLAGGLALAGALWTRVSTLQRGAESAARPEISFRFAQPDNLPVRPARARVRRVRRPARPAPRGRPTPSA